MYPELENTYVKLNEDLYVECDPEPVSDPVSVRVNDELAECLGFGPEWLASDEGAEFAVGNRILDGSRPVAMAYAGDQYGQFQPQLGDGRAHLLGEVVDGDGRRFDIHLKGSGRTAFSRQGDGRAPLGPVLREYLVSEATHSMGIPTTRSLTAASTGETVRRRNGPEPGAVLVRVARSHIRVGTFQYFAARDNTEALRDLTIYTVQRHYPELESTDPVDLFDGVVDRQAELIAQWQLVGFVHGVMNTDNTLLSGETIDYGPCAFMNDYDPETVFSSIDRYGRYAYKEQPSIARWNLQRFAGALLKLAGEDSDMETELESILDDFMHRYQTAYNDGIAEKLGLEEFRSEDEELVDDFFDRLEENNVDFTLAFRRLTELADPDSDPEGRTVGEFFTFPSEFVAWLDRWQERLQRQDRPATEVAESMRSTNPVLIPRNYHINDAIEQAVEHDNYDKFHELADVLTSPFDWPDGQDELLHPPTSDQRVKMTFCGT
ncbi:MAG: YdiU family protein [bacterium]